MFEHPGLLAEPPDGPAAPAAAPAVAMPEPTAFLYPFIEADERDAAGLLDAMAASARAKLAETAALRDATRTALAPTLDAVAVAVAERVAAGGRVLTFGNGGSATDAQAAAALLRDPPRGRPVPARALVDDPAVLTALANDVGFDLVVARQVIAHARPGDVALGFSTSGESPNVLRGCEEAARRGLLTVATAGYEGGALAASPAVHHSPRRAFAQRAPHPGDPGNPHPRPLVEGPGRSWGRRVAACLSRRWRATGKRRSWPGSRRSAAGRPGCSTRW